MHSFIDKIFIQRCGRSSRSWSPSCPAPHRIVVFAVGLVLAWLVKLLVIRIIKLLSWTRPSPLGRHEALQKMAVRTRRPSSSGGCSSGSSRSSFRACPERDAGAGDRPAPREVPALSANIFVAHRPGYRWFLAIFSVEPLLSLGERRLQGRRAVEQRDQGHHLAVRLRHGLRTARIGGARSLPRSRSCSAGGLGAGAGLRLRRRDLARHG